MAQQNNNIEKEVKFRIRPKLSKSQLKDFLKGLGLFIEKEILQKDIYWDNHNCDIINLKRGFRIRYVSGKIKDIEFKSLFKKNNGEYVIEEVKLFKDGMLDLSALKNILVSRLGVCTLEEFNDFNSDFLEMSLTKLGLSPVVTLEKERSIWVDEKGEIEVSLDVVSGLGIFIEVEQVGDTDRVFDKVIKRLSESVFVDRDTTHSGYLDLILNKNCKITSKTDFEKKFRLDNKWNVKPNEEDVYLSLTK